MEYKGIKIPKDIIIVEKIPYEETEIHQAYVVEDGNENQLESAKGWAKTIRYEKDSHKSQVIEGICHKYKNGKFYIKLKESADRSSQGGKLSFWNCIITCPDKKEFLIGINADILVEFILNNTLEFDECDEPVYFGRVSGNVGVFTKNMPSYKQFLADEKQRDDCKKATTKYEVGDVVKTLTTESLYLGTTKQRFSYGTDYIWGGKRDYIFYIAHSPKTVHVMRDTKYGSLEFFDKKPKRTIVEHCENIPTVSDAINTYYNSRYIGDELKKLAYNFKGTDEELIEAIKDTETLKRLLRDGMLNSIRFSNV